MVPLTEEDGSVSSEREGAIASQARSESGVDTALVVFVAITLCLVATNLWFVTTHSARDIVTIARLLGPIAVLLTAVFAVWWTRQNGYERYLGHVSVWTLAGTVLLGLCSFTEQWYQYSKGLLVEPTYVPVLGWACGGFVVGTVVGVYSARTRAQRAQTERARRQAEQLAEAQSVLNRVLRHDIRNNVNIVEGYVDLIADEETDPEHVETIHEHTSRIVRLAEYARETERLVSQQGAGIESMDLVNRLDSIRREVQETYPDANLVTDFPERAPVCANDLIDSAFENLLENAIEHHPGPEPEVRMSVVREDDEFVVTVADDGAGIPETEVSVFESGDESGLEHSNGMGLWLVKWIVAYSDGELDFVKNDSSGSEIAIRLPTRDTST